MKHSRIEHASQGNFSTKRKYWQNLTIFSDPSPETSCICNDCDYKQLVEATIQADSSMAKYFDFNKTVLISEEDFLIEVSNAVSCDDKTVCEPSICAKASLDHDKVSYLKANTLVANPFQLYQDADFIVVYIRLESSQTLVSFYRKSFYYFITRRISRHSTFRFERYLPALIQASTHAPVVKFALKMI